MPSSCSACSSDSSTAVSASRSHGSSCLSRARSRRRVVAISASIRRRASSEAAAQIIGLRTEKIGEVLGSLPYEEMVHRDNLVITM